MVLNLFLIYFFYNFSEKFFNILSNTKLQYLQIVTIFSSLHAFYLGTISLLYLLNYIVNYKLWLTFMVGYTIFDINCIYYKENPNKVLSNKQITMIFHHSLMILSYFYMLFYSNYINYERYLAQIYLCEFSTIFFNLLYYLNKSIKKRKTGLFINLSRLVLFLYFVLRILNFTHLSFVTINNKDYLCFLFISLILTLNLSWFTILHSKYMDLFEKPQTKEY